MSPSPIPLVSGNSTAVGIAIDRSGALLPTMGDRVVRATSTNSTQIIARNGFFRSTGDDGVAQDAPVYDMMGKSADAAGNVYLAERDGNRIRKVSSAGVISTTAGTGTGG